MSNHEETLRLLKRQEQDFEHIQKEILSHKFDVDTDSNDYRVQTMRDICTKYNWTLDEYNERTRTEAVEQLNRLMSGWNIAKSDQLEPQTSKNQSLRAWKFHK